MPNEKIESCSSAPPEKRLKRPNIVPDICSKKLFTTADLAAQMQGKVWLDQRAGLLVDEIPSAYKDIDQVMRDQSDLVEVLHTLHQVLNYKGT